MNFAALLLFADFVSGHYASALVGLVCLGLFLGAAFSGLHAKSWLKKLRETYSSGSTDFVKVSLLKAEVQLSSYLDRLNKLLVHLEEEFSRDLDRWFSRPFPDQVRPQRVTRLVRLGWLCLFCGGALTALEFGLFTALAASLGVNVFFASGLALMFTIGTKVFILLTTDRPEQPLVQKSRILHYALCPSGGLFLFSGAALLLFARTDAGDHAAALIGLVNLSLFLLSVSCMGLSAALLALGWLFLSSFRAERHYVRFETERAIILAELKFVTERLGNPAQFDPGRKELSA
jgi:hypothetical protein